MAKREYIQRHLMIINRLRQHPSSFEELQKYLRKQEEIIGDNFEITQRTFQRDKHDILSIYGIEIKFNKKENWYEIVNEEEDKPYDRIVEAIETFNALNISNGLSHKIVLERRKSLGTEYMFGLLHAINHQLKVTFTHHKYWENKMSEKTVCPIAIKESQNRWYLVAEDCSSGIVKTYGLERISNFEISKTTFKPIVYNVEQEYKNAFGVVREGTPQKIVLSFMPQQAGYIKSLPIHPSQKIILDTETEFRIELFLYPTYDFEMFLLQFGSWVKVLEPQDLRNCIIDTLKETLDLYKQ